MTAKVSKWRWMGPEERKARDIAIREKYAMGVPVITLARLYDLSQPRIRQIVVKP